ncbi:ATPase with chaperone activity [Orrella sp. 11846]|uniref:ATPase with chaperone activity n=1 Tax=Orrella sp. 11846 TaxID=3409913 RepID=UPI003B5A8BB3
MYSENQIYVSPSFIELHKHPITGKLQATRPWLQARYELCEDFAQLLAQQTQQKMFELQITQADALERVDRGLYVKPSPLDLAENEIEWIRLRIQELLQHASF